MNPALIQKGIGVSLILSGVVLLVFKTMSLPEAKESWESWASPDSGTTLFAGALTTELLLLIARFYLGYINFQNMHLSSWVFYPLAMLVAISGLSGVILVVTCLAFRFWQKQAHVAKT